MDPNDIVFGGAGGVNGDVAIGTTNQLLGGSIITYGAMTGVNLGRWNQPRWTVFANGFYDTQTIRGLTGHLLTLGRMSSISSSLPCRAHTFAGRASRRQRVSSTRG